MCRRTKRASFIVMKKKIILGIGAVVAVFIIIASVKALQIFKLIAFSKTYVQPPETISSAVARAENWPDTLTAIGSVTADQGVMISPEIGGAITEISFESGVAVKKGDLIVKLDTSSEEAQLRAAEAQADLARVNAERDRQLRVNNTVSQSELDSAEALLKQSQANADAIRATINKKNIRAPFSGKLGIRLVNLGEQVDVGKPIVSLQSLAPVFVDFTLPQQELEKLKTGLKIVVTSDTYPGRQFQGELTAINPDLESTTRSVQLRAKFANDDELLRPGMFVRVEVVLEDAQSVLAIPSTAVMRAPYGDAVYLIETQTINGVTSLIAQQKFIRIGRSHGDYVSVESGLEPGARVATAGLFKLHNGAPVQENNTNSPAPSLSPTPPNS